jgi:uncharacterized surface protein with fasciclin (FAS1) repeats
MTKRILAAAAVAISFTAALAVPASAHERERERDDDREHQPVPAPSATLAQVLLSDSAGDDADGFDHNGWDYDIVTQAVLRFPDLTAAASDPNASLTVFLPTDNAFKRLVKSLSGTWPATEKATFDAVAGLGLDTVKTVLTYHIVPGAKIDYRTARKSDGAELTTLQGGTITVDVKGWGRRVTLVDKDPDARDPKVVQPNIGGEALNGYAHGIDRVLRPIDL